jgi:hypothetical protein
MAGKLPDKSSDGKRKHNEQNNHNIGGGAAPEIMTATII